MNKFPHLKSVKIPILISLALLVFGIMMIYPKLTIKNLPQTGITQPLSSSQPTSSPKGQISVVGELVCVPHKNTNGPQTMECAYGLKAENGVYYGLQDSDPMYKNISGVSMNKRVEVTGSIELKEDSKYDTIGLITVTSLKQLN